jgi:NitT/TauT family transport system substrate-binding protein
MIARRTALAALAAAAAAVLAPPAQAQAPTKVDIAYVPVADFIPVYVAQELGLYKKHGLDAKITAIPLAPTIPAAITAGSIQIGMTTPPIFLQARAGGLDLVAVSALSWEFAASPQLTLVAKKGDGIKTAKDFEGKTVAVPGLQSLADATTRKWLKVHGADISKISFVEVGMPQLVDVLKSGTVDAIAAIEPFGSIAIGSGAGVMISHPLEDLHDGAVLVFWIANGAWAKANPKGIAGFRAAMDEAVDYIRANPDKAKAICAKYIKHAPDKFTTWKTALTVADLKFYEDLSRELGFLKGPVNLDDAILK